ncbi:hypothetical protein GCM10012287_29600 [Streptomyces daqingensis]|uniref:Uncharacterized protein n=1 Tax=Streptomyces daqingensis TaxID=1472640 RepID=A0ABQ2MEU1_9ACTN|nr:hypothetical protein GCM10012287_29600 [Streptomyces daqingensis]
MTRARVSGETRSGLFSAFDTVPMDTPARRATSLMLTMKVPPPPTAATGVFPPLSPRTILPRREIRFTPVGDAYHGGRDGPPSTALPADGASGADRPLSPSGQP